MADLETCGAASCRCLLQVSLRLNDPAIVTSDFPGLAQIVLIIQYHYCMQTKRVKTAALQVF